MEAELLQERGATGRAATEWMNKTHALRQELDMVQDIANKLDSMYKLSEEECRRLRAQFKCQEDDREFLVRQVRVWGPPFDPWGCAPLLHVRMLLSRCSDSAR